MRRLLLLAAALLVASCDQSNDTLKVGGKDFSESRILGEMIAALAEKQQIPVTRRIGLGSTLVNLESLKRGEIDIYPEYNGTGLVMLGQPALSDGDAAMERVRALYEPLGLSWGERIGFNNTYGIAMRSSRAEELGVATISDLIGKAGSLTIGIEQEFASRPLDGMQPFTSRYGIDFGNVVTVSADERPKLYDRLLDGDVDVIEVFTTDGQISASGLTVLRDDLSFFPVYQAVPLLRSDALVRFPALRSVLDQLAGKIDEATMRDLNAQVDQDALAPAAVARAALAQMGLLDGTGLEIEEPLHVATSPLGIGDAESNTALRGVREAFPGRRVVLDVVNDPLDAVGSGAARVGLVTAVDFAALDAGGAPQVRPFEAVGVVGQSYLQVVSLKPEVRRFADVKALATGPEGSSSYDAGRMLAAGLDGLSVEPVAADDFVPAAKSSGADAALVLAPLDSPVVAALAAQGPLLAVTGWEAGNNLVRFPYLRQARIPAGTYQGQSGAIETLASQLVLAGPVVQNLDAVGPQGPGASAPTPVSELSDETITALSTALGSAPGIDPAIPSAPILSPRLPAGPAAVNPSYAVSLMTLAVFVLFGWLVWLYARPETEVTAMPRKILVPIDLVHEASWKSALPAAFDLATAPDDEVVVMTVVPEIAAGLDWRYAIRGETGGSEKLDIQGILEDAKTRLEQIANEYAPPDRAVEVIARYGTIYEEILNIAGDLPADQIVMAATRPSLSDYLLGPNTARVVRHARCSVQVVRD